MSLDEGRQLIWYVGWRVAVSIFGIDGDDPAARIMNYSSRILSMAQSHNIVCRHLFIWALNDNRDKVIDLMCYNNTFSLYVWRSFDILI